MAYRKIFSFGRRALFHGAVLFCWAGTVSAQIFSPLHTFSAASGFQAPLMQGSDGTFYGTSSGGGLGGGTVFRVNPDGTHFAILHAFGPGSPFGSGYINPDGYAPVAGLTLSNNVLYGTTKLGGAAGYGSVFKINTDGSGFSTLRFFTNGVDGGTLSGGLVLADGALYGTTESGVGTNHGTIFKINTDGTGFAILRTFGFDTNGATPMASMILSGGTLYGTCRSGSVNGTVFKIDTNGLNFAVLHRFTATSAGTNIDGAAPEASMVLSSNTLYGTASSGGSGYGTVFAMSIDGNGFTNLYSFTNGLDGGTPVAAVTLSGNTLYGTTTKGGPDGSLGAGTIFKINTDGSGFTAITNFATFRGGGMPGGGTGGLIVSGDTLFGAGGAVVFSIKTNGTNPGVLSKGDEGAQPLGGLVLSGNTFYGTTSAGGLNGSGTIFQVKTNGADFSLLYSFSATTNNTNGDGTTPVGTLVLAGGKLYGVAKLGGASNVGTIFGINTNGTGFTNLHSFTDVPDGRLPYSGLVLGGNTLYGTTRNGGISNSGTIFKINTDGSDYQTIFSFSNLAAPESGLVLSGGTLYGTTLSGGTNGDGSVFKINTSGTGFTELYSFKAPTNNTDTVNVNGAGPIGDLILSGNTLYGTTASGGTGAGGGKGGTPGNGTVFEINTDGTGFVRLHAFAGGFEGITPMAGLALSGNTLYGTTSSGGNGDGGTVFQLNTDGNNFATIHTFAFQGGTPMGDLIVANGTIYGTTEFSDQGSGYVFSVTPTAAPTIQFAATPTNGIPPQAVQFTAPGTDDYGNPILGWYWNFDDGTPTYTIIITTNHGGVFTNYNYISTQNPLHTYTNSGAYAPSLIATNNNGTMVLGFGPAVTIAYPTSILNGGFETGTFTNWTRTGVAGSSVSTGAQYKHSGSYGANLSASGGLGFLSQTISTKPGSSYLVSFWLDVPFGLSGTEFRVTWGDTVLMDQTNLPTSGWTNIQFLVTATNTSTVLQFAYQGFFGLDDVSVTSIQPVISGFKFSGGNLVLTNTGGISNRTYVVLTSTNAAQPLNEWIPVSTNVLGSNGNFSITASNAVNPNARQQFYILQMQ